MDPKTLAALITAIAALVAALPPLLAELRMEGASNAKIESCLMDRPRLAGM